MREACGAAHMKAILATGELKTLRNVYAASMVAMQAGADFIKTSTGKEDVNATLPVSLVMLRALRDYRERDGLRHRLQARRRHPHRQGRDQLAHSDARGTGLAVDAQRPVPHRRERRCSPTSNANSNIGRPAAIPRATATRWGRPMAAIAELMETMEYGPSPEADDAVRGWLRSHDAGFGHFIDGKFTKPGAICSTSSSPRAARKSRASRKGRRGRCRRRGRRGAEGAAGLERRSPAIARARIFMRWRGMIQKRERFLAVLESIDNGKPIRETRDADIPLVARHFYHHAGWASLIESEFPGAKPVGVCGQIIPGISRC